MAINEILKFCETDTGSNLLTQPQYDVDPERLIGNTPSTVARAKLVNKVLRQSSTVVSGLSQYVADYQVNDIDDSLSEAVFSQYIYDAIQNQVNSTVGLVKRSEVYQSTNQSFNVTASAFKIVFQNNSNDTLGWWNLINNRWIPNIAGWYKLHLALTLRNSSANGNFALDFHKNASTYSAVSELWVGATGDLCISGSREINLNGTTDYVEAFLRTGSATITSQSGVNSTVFEISYMGE